MGVVSAPTLTLPSTEGINYTAHPSGPYAPGQSVIGDGDLGPGGSRLAGDHAGGLESKTSPTTATYTVTFDHGFVPAGSTGGTGGDPGDVCQW